MYKCVKFSGDKNKDKMTFSAWAKVYERMIDPPQRGLSLASYLEGQALQYYADKIMDTADDEWEIIKVRLTQRFDPIKLRNLHEGMRRSLRLSESVEDYYQAKLDLLEGTSATYQEILETLTGGLPKRWQPVMEAATITSLEQWLRMAKTFEASEKNKAPKPRTRSSFLATTSSSAPRSGSPTSQAATGRQRRQQGWKQGKGKRSNRDERRPPNPCRLCKEKLKRDFYHWYPKDCPLHFADSHHVEENEEEEVHLN